MPRRRRLMPGQNYGSSGAPIDLGGLLMQALGGVEANPDFQQEVPRPSDSFVGPQPLKPGADNPYKARSVFDRNEAARRNAEFKVENYLADKDVDRQVGLETQLGQVKSNQLLDLLQRRIPIDTQALRSTNAANAELRQKEAIIDVLKQLGMNPTDQNIQVYTEMNSPAQQETAAQNILGALAAAIGKRKETEFGNKVFDVNKQAAMIEASAKANTGAALAEGEYKQVGDVLTNRRRMLQGEPVWREGQMLSSRLQPITPGTSLFNTATGKLAYDAPDQIQRAMNIGNTPAPQAIQSPAPTGYRIEDLIIDPQTGQIIGVKPRKMSPAQQ